MFEGSFLARSRHMAGMSKGTAKMSNANVKNLKVKTHLPPPRAGPVTLGSDCSGWESLSKAAKCIGLNAKLKFASDINVHCRTMIAETEDSDVKIYHDMCMRAPGDAGSVDVYGAGFPCQPFSSIGKRRGATDARAGVTAHILKFIASAKPRCFILETVKGLLEELALLLQLDQDAVQSQGPRRHTVLCCSLVSFEHHGLWNPTKPLQTLHRGVGQKTRGCTVCVAEQSQDGPLGDVPGPAGEDPAAPECSWCTEEAVGHDATHPKTWWRPEGT